MYVIVGLEQNVWFDWISTLNNSFLSFPFFNVEPMLAYVYAPQKGPLFLSLYFCEKKQEVWKCDILSYQNEPKFWSGLLHQTHLYPKALMAQPDLIQF